jgi:hypothetical protein
LVEGGHLGEARLEHAKQLGRAAYAILRTPDVCGMCDLEGEEKHLREFAQGSLVMDMMTPFRSSGLSGSAATGFSKNPVKDARPTLASQASTRTLRSTAVNA